MGTINIRSEKGEDKGAGIHLITKEVAKASLRFYCLREVRFRNCSRQNYQFLSCRMKKHREAGAESLIRVDPNISVNETNDSDPRIIAINLIYKIT